MLPSWPHGESAQIYAERLGNSCVLLNAVGRIRRGASVGISYHKRKVGQPKTAKEQIISKAPTWSPTTIPHHARTQAETP